MIKLTHLVYCSTATKAFSNLELADLLKEARDHNISIDVTGMLLFENGSFFQIIEGAPNVIDQLYQSICEDGRHTKVITIIHEPIHSRSFDEWTMGYSSVSTEEVEEIIGQNDFFNEGESFTQLDQGRAKKLLMAFKGGRWRSKIQSEALTASESSADSHSKKNEPQKPPKISFAFQPIVDLASSEIVSYQAFLRTNDNKAISSDFNKRLVSEWHGFENRARASAIKMAAALELNCNLTLNYTAARAEDADEAIRTTITATEINGIDPSRIDLRIYQGEIIGEPGLCRRIIHEYRAAGIKISIAQFGAGRASLSLLEHYLPDSISLNPRLVSDISINGACQAILRGLHQTCSDLGIDIIASHIDSYASAQWLFRQGITIQQGNYIGEAAFEKLPQVQFPIVDNE